MNRLPLIVFIFQTFFLASPALTETVEDVYFGSTAMIADTPVSYDTPVILKSFEDYNLFYGEIGDKDLTAKSVKGFFKNGGTKLYLINPQYECTDDLYMAYDLALKMMKGLDVEFMSLPAASFLSEYTVYKQIILNFIDILEKNNAFGLIDVPASLTYDESKLIQLAEIFSTQSAAMFAPWLSFDADDLFLPASAHIAGVMTRLDRAQGIFRPAAGPQAFVHGISSLNREFSNRDIAQLNEFGVNVLRYLSPLNGYFIWGTRHLSPSQYAPYISTYRFKTFLKNSIESSLSEINEESEVVIEDYLSHYWERGAFAGSQRYESYFVRCGVYELNSCEVGISLQRPSEFIVFSVSKAEIYL